MRRLINGVICLKDRLIKNKDLVIRDGKISLEAKNKKSKEKIIDTSSINPEHVEWVDLNGSYVLPGFIEIHTHGAALFEFTAGRYNRETKSFNSSPEIYEKELPEYVRIRASTGVSNLFLGTWATSTARLRFCFRELKKYMDSGNNGKDGSLIKGGLLEGTFFNPNMCGAQNPDYALKPDIKIFDEINEYCAIKLVNVVPDYGEASFRLIRNLTKRGISVGAGHTNATADQFKEAVDNGLKYAIHFLNGPTGGSYKPFGNGGAIEGILNCSHIYVELILDGIHVNPSYVRDVIDRKGIDRVIAVTDAMFTSQSKGVTDFTINKIQGRLSKDRKYVYVPGKKPFTLFSSIVTMDKAFSNLLSFLTKDMNGIWYRRHKGMELSQAIPIAAKMCATNACAMLKMRGGQDLETGSIEEGNWADLVIGDIKGKMGNYKLDIKKVFVRGKEL